MLTEVRSLATKRVKAYGVKTDGHVAPSVPAVSMDTLVNSLPFP